MPEISVVLPTYNEANAIQDALDGLAEQTFRDFEVVVVDDGSTDGTVDIITSEDRLDITLIERNKSGLPSALNRGIREANGVYIARQDADDRSHPKRFERQIEVLQENESLALLGTGAILEYADGRRSQRHVLESVTRDQLLAGNRFIHGSVLIRKRVVECVGGYDEDFRYTEDYDLWLRIAENYSIGNVNEPLYRLRMRDSSIYGSALREVLLYGQFARLRATGEVTEEQRSAFRDGDLDQLYQQLTEQQKREIHMSLLLEHIRYDDNDAAQTEGKNAIELGFTVMILLLIVLTYMPRRVQNLALYVGRVIKNSWVRYRNISTDSQYVHTEQV
ncbi:glycosyltransferase [Halorubrum salsamenti]|uniref:glycosyltransferase n=1 Tax=Halorubrum salsamenti TaxID=2583990 RepID=UPI0011A3B5B6|nr:glycosyltransferase [Halorubrum salsamenti]